MKIKKYDIQDLVDYLQEFCDKNHIVEYDAHIKKTHQFGTETPYYNNMWHGINYSRNPPYFYIANIQKSDYERVYDDLSLIVPNIEKRFGLKLNIHRNRISDIPINNSISIYYNLPSSHIRRLPERLYIKKYEALFSGDSFNIEDLEDYLQEFFDEFHIIKYHQPRAFGTIPPRIFYYETKNGITIDSIPTGEIKTLKDKLVQIKPQIEKRMGRKVDIESHNGFKDGRITIERHFRVIQNGGHSIGYYESVAGWKVEPGSTIEKLEDCLQEIFDKFHIKEKICGFDGKDYTDQSYMGYYIRIEYSKIDKKYSHYIRIENIPLHFENHADRYPDHKYRSAMYIIIEEIKKIENTIEKRIGAKIKIEEDFALKRIIDIKII